MVISSQLLWESRKASQRIIYTLMLIMHRKKKLRNFTYSLLTKIIAIYYWRRQWQPTPVFLPGKSHGWRSLEGCSPQGRWGLDMTERLHFTFHFHALEKEMATHSSVLDWRIPGMGEPGGLLSMGSHRVGHDWSDLAAAAAAIYYKVIWASTVPWKLNNMLQKIWLYVDLIER